MRRAILECTPEFLRDGGFGPIADHGLEALYSLESAPGMIALVVEGAALPEACEARAGSALQVVTVTFSQEVYGRQRLTKVVSIEPNGRTGLDLASRALRAA